MVYTSKTINRNFRIKASGLAPNGERINKLVGVSGLLYLIGEEFTDKFVAKAFAGKGDSMRFKLRRGIIITLYNK